MKPWIFGVAIAVGVAGGVSAQTPPQVGDAEQLRARQKIFMMERVLEGAVAIGVDSLRRQVRAVMPDDALLLSGAPGARGFRLEGYGIMFDVEVPGLRPSMAWMLRTMNQTGVALARDLEQVRAFVQSVADPRVKAELDRTLRRIQQQMGPPAAPAPERAVAQAGPAVAAQSIAPAAAGSVAPPGAPPADPVLLLNPDEAYTREVKGALIDAMIENSGGLLLGPDEWLTVAARDNDQIDRFMPGDPTEAMTLVLRIKGSDLAAFQARRITLEEARKRVEVREF